MGLEGGFFKGEKDLDGRLAEVDAELATDGQTNESSETEADGDETNSDLFTADEAEDEGDEEGEAEALFDEEEGEEGGGDSKTVPYTRLQKVIKERNELRAALAKAEGSTEGLQAALDANQDLVETIAEKYAGFKNPAGMLAFDADFMSAMEQVSKTDDSVASVAARVQEFMKTGEFAKPAKGEQVSEEQNEEPQGDARVDTIIRRDAQRTIDGALQDLKPSFRGLIGKLITNNSDTDDLAELTAKEVRGLAKQYIQDNGFEPGDVLLPSDGKAPKKSAKPATSGGSGKAASAPAKSSEKNDDGPKPPKTMDEWSNSREKRLKAFFE